MAGTCSFEGIPLCMRGMLVEPLMALPTRHQLDLAPGWLVVAGSDRDGEQWEKHWSSALEVTEIPSGSDSFLAQSGGSASSCSPCRVYLLHLGCELSRL